ncbi:MULTISPECIES: YscO family type III secretion system apparatus protein [Pseudomonas]|jgi:chromosome segregation ATPase|uniref:YscO family type III secretion system apparatus protein n=2 Tax=Pseudomonas TaxID=286 RepID=A0A7Y8G0M8_9PSED|nr:MULTISPECIES: YscO family type III secretion system apparatus protein [Pseudomonas]KGE69457.1 type III secretion protein [Pseudomonas fluorescens LMG 5329]NWC74174.1 YscO family type III secretion system apparatus protein [Pseudomonas sp. P7759]NWD81023.1 YscO family type III secretion system apparatus protein [Pseudomonas reactans]NWE00461.1 YscO family type III secretion system apparatus protein [Pseudomonas sp. IPO3749]NWE89026.1 YscO family type III secretion system apparatus protein [P
MSHSDGLLGEVETLRRLRRHRADRAERALREAKRAQQALLANIRQAEDALEQIRRDEAERSAQLLSEHQGQVLNLQALKSWGAQERSLSANTRRGMGQLEALQGQQEERQTCVGRAQKQVTACLRQVEKLQELSLLLAQEPT